jgi:hypothetical protein
VLKVGPAETPNRFGPLIFKSYQAVCQGTDYPMLMSLHMSIISWMLLRFPEECNTFMNQLENYNITSSGTFSKESNENISPAAGRLLDVWIEKMPLVTQTDRRKLMSLGLSSLLVPSSQIVNERIYGIIQNVTETLNDIMKYEDDTKTYTE